MVFKRYKSVKLKSATFSQLFFNDYFLIKKEGYFKLALLGKI